MKEIQVAQVFPIVNKYFEFTPGALIVHGEPSFEECMAMLVTLKRVGRSIQLWIGDLLNYSEDRFGEVVAQFLEEWEYGTLANWAWVARKVTPELRQAVTPRGEVLHYEHYRTVAPLPPAEQKEWLTRAVAEGWSGRRLAQEVSGGSGGVLYDGPGQAHFQEFDRWVVWLPPGVELQASAGDEVRVIVRSVENHRGRI